MLSVIKRLTCFMEYLVPENIELGKREETKARAIHRSQCNMCSSTGGRLEIFSEKHIHF